MITVFSDNKEIPVNRVEFSDGAITFRLNELPPNPRYITINVDPCTPVKDVREELTMVCSCIQQFYKATTFRGLPFPVNLNMPYTCYGRADRVFEEGNPTAPLYTFLSFIKGLCFNEVNICDLHNPSVIKDWVLDLNNTLFKNKPQLECFKQSIPYDFNEEYNYIVAPDAGAMDKARTIASHLETEIIYASKERDVSTGRILKTTLPDDIDLKGAKVLIPDDLCDGAGTFIFLAKALKERGASEIHLYVTHGIFSKGLKCLTGVIDKVYCYQTVMNYVNKQTINDFNNGKI